MYIYLSLSRSLSPSYGGTRRWVKPIYRFNYTVYMCLKSCALLRLLTLVPGPKSCTPYNFRLNASWMRQNMTDRILTLYYYIIYDFLLLCLLKSTSP